MSKDLKERKAVTQADTQETARVKAHMRSLQSILRNNKETSEAEASREKQ